MQAKNHRARSRSFSLRSVAKPALYLGFMVAAASCAAELEDPARYKVANETTTATGGTAPAATGGTGGGGASAMGGTKATGGTGGPTGGSASNVTTIDPCVKTEFATCTACHSATGKINAADLDLSGDDAAVIARLKDVVATNKGVSNPNACVSGSLLINSANPAESVFLKRVKGTQSCGGPMPFPPGLTGANLKCIEDWVMKF